MPKNVLIYSHFFYPSIGGTEKTSEHFANALNKLGYHSVILTETPLGSNKELDQFTVVRTSKTLSFFYLIWYSLKADLVVVKGAVSLLPVLVAKMLGKKMFIYHEMHGSYLYDNKTRKRTILSALKRGLLPLAKYHVG